MRFRDRVCIVTGGTSGIGLATAARLVAEGGRVAVVGRDAGRGRTAQAQLGGAARADGPPASGTPGGQPSAPQGSAPQGSAPQGSAPQGWAPGGHAVFERADVASEGDARRAVAAVVARWGRVDVLVNNAAVMTFRPVEELSVADWDHVLAVNLRGAFLFARECIPHMPRGAAIVNVSSVHAHETTIDVAPYAASKGALESFTRALSRELAPRGIRVNCVAPGAVDTPMLWGNPNVKSGREQVEGRVGRPEDIAAAIAFAAAPEAAFMDGAVLVVDGGRLDVL